MKDRVAKYFTKYLDDFAFLELTPDYIKKRARINFMVGVPIPVRKQFLTDFAGGEGLNYEQITEAMIFVIGADRGFKYNEKYVDFMKQFNPRILKQVVKKGVDFAEDEEYDEAAIHLRTALYLDDTSLDALYNYARVCRQLYLNAEGGGQPEYVTDFKTEAYEGFLATTQKHTRFAQAYYFLGYAYLNAGKYQDAAGTWTTFMKKSRNRADRKEIRTRMEQIKEPMTLEEGCNQVMAGHFKEGIAILEPYKNSTFDKWWPLSYYLGVAYSKTGEKQEAVAMLKRVLGLNASHIETMQELTKLYHDLGDKENEEKYKNKVTLILENIALEKEQERSETSKAASANGKAKKKTRLIQ